MKTKKSKNPKAVLKEMEKILKSKECKPIPAVGDLIEGNIINLSKNEVHVDIEGLTTGVIRGPELFDELGEYKNIKMGDKILTTILELENEKGEMELSLKEASHKKAWENLSEIMKKGEITEVKVSDANKGGLIVKLGQIVSFLPTSQLSPQYYPRVEDGNKNKILEKLKALVNKTLKVKIIGVDEKENKLIVSEKEVWKEKQKNTLENYKIGDVVEGTVSGIIDFGIFVKFGKNLEGLIHISELGWQRISHPKNLFKDGDKVKAKIIDIEGEKISLSIKQLILDPWKKAVEKYKEGDVVKGKVLKVNPFGLFVELDEFIHGLAHISELSNKVIKNPNEIAKKGDVLDFKILSIESGDHRLGLSLKALENNQDEKKENN
ncbi:MAG: RNA binding S1 protein [Parcubacteria group bacterium Athens1014_10]|nr:MAG: RNA binding S1 protein [Parcubacteria group bacterium Athens1014_10]TSD05108.1 MAG: RNA binding S1 protein [Parcubacteria group bacterium Athens0714_12]